MYNNLNARIANYLWYHISDFHNATGSKYFIDWSGINLHFSQEGRIVINETSLNCIKSQSYHYVNYHNFAPHSNKNLHIE